MLPARDASPFGEIAAADIAAAIGSRRTPHPGNPHLLTTTPAVPPEATRRAGGFPVVAGRIRLERPATTAHAPESAPF
jgi:hypothetical protein